ncbi:hypothetical protein AAVH_25218, partial [Aphelenchoides avenae]
MLSLTTSLALILIFPSVHSLKCFQGQQNASTPVQGAAIDCLANSQSCIRTYDPTTNSVTRACLISNCTVSVRQRHAQSSEDESDSESESGESDPV